MVIDLKRSTGNEIDYHTLVSLMDGFLFNHKYHSKTVWAPNDIKVIVLSNSLQPTERGPLDHHPNYGKRMLHRHVRIREGLDAKMKKKKKSS